MTITSMCIVKKIMFNNYQEMKEYLAELEKQGIKYKILVQNTWQPKCRLIIAEKCKGELFFEDVQIKKGK